MSETKAPAPPKNGAVAPTPTPPTPATEQPQLQLPEGAIQLPPAMVATFTRLVQGDQRVQDILYSYLQGKGETGPYSLVIPVILLLPPKEG